MPKLKTSAYEKSLRSLKGNIKKRMDMQDVSSAELSHLIGCNPRTFQNKVNEPECFTVRELLITLRKLHFTESEVLEWIGLALMRGE